jgi:GDP-4-dehydro-6-deoxy-D-mannose reductase
MDPLRVLVTGVHGFVGGHMIRHLLDRGMHVIGVGRRSAAPLVHERFFYHACDLLDTDRWTQLLMTEPFHYVIHLAAQNHVLHAWQSPFETFRINTEVTARLLEILRHKTELKGIILAGSAQEYHMGKTMEPLDETASEQANHPYGVSKWMQTAWARLYGKGYGVPVVVARTFNLIGPGQTKGVCAQIARQVAEMERGERPPELRVGNRWIRRDFLDVRDAVRAYADLLTCAPEPGEVFNVCRGTAYAIGEMIDVFRRLARCRFQLISDPRLFRKEDPPIILGNPRKLMAVTSWKPVVPLERTVRDVLEEWRKKEGRE